MMSWKAFGRKLSWLHFKALPGIHLEGLKKNTKNLWIADLQVEI
jgi:hypothetical protein